MNPNFRYYVKILYFLVFSILDGKLFRSHYVLPIAIMRQNSTQNLLKHTVRLGECSIEYIN